MQQTSENRCATRRNTYWDIVIATTLCAPNKKEVTIQVLRFVFYILRAGELVWGSDSNTQLSRLRLLFHVWYAECMQTSG